MHLQPKVSVCVVTYNQEQYITQCLQSIVEQEVDFNFEIIVSDDGSTDNTQNIILNFAKKYPSIRPIFHDKNIGALKNFIFAHRQAKGEYVAHIDGDDYILPNKLQSQSDYLDAHDEISFSAHAARVIGGNTIIGNSALYPEVGTIEDLLNLGTYFINSSIMYRLANEFIHPEDFETVDFYLHVERASKGGVYLDKRTFGCYRDHEQGISKVSAYKKKIESCYFDAFDRAIELGVSEDVVIPAYLKRKKTFAFSRYFAGDVLGFQDLIFLKKTEIFHASKFHYFLHLTRSTPLYMWLFNQLRIIKKKLC